MWTIKMNVGKKIQLKWTNFLFSSMLVLLLFSLFVLVFLAELHWDWNRFMWIYCWSVTKVESCVHIQFSHTCTSANHSWMASCFVYVCSYVSFVQKPNLLQFYRSFSLFGKIKWNPLNFLCIDSTSTKKAYTHIFFTRRKSLLHISNIELQLVFFFFIHSFLRKQVMCERIENGCIGFRKAVSFALTSIYLFIYHFYIFLVSLVCFDFSVHGYTCVCAS